MAGSVNKVILVGNLGADPDIRTTNEGKRIANFSIATSESWKDRQTGERRERTEWHRVVIFNDGLSGVVEQYLRKGSKVYVEGKLATRKWQDNSGQDRYTTEVVLQAYNGELHILGSRSNGPPPAEDAGDYGSQITDTQGTRRDYSADLDDEIPF